MTSTRLLLLPLLTTTPSSSSSTTSCSFRSHFKKPWLCGGKRHPSIVSLKIEDGNEVSNMFGSDDEFTTQIPSQEPKRFPKGQVQFLSPSINLPLMLIIYRSCFFGTRNMGFMHQELIEILSFAMVITKNHIFTSGASGTNAAVIRGALRAERPELLTVILPQSLKKQPLESQELLSKELLAIQQQGPRNIGFFGIRNMGFMHQELIQILSYAMVIKKNHIFTSGASGTNAAVIRGALRAERPDLLTVILPQSLEKQPILRWSTISVT